MSESVSKRNELLELLKDEPLTTKQMEEKLNIPVEHIWVYLSQFQKESKVEKVGKSGKFNLYKQVETSLSSLDTQILMKMIPSFIKKGIEIELDNEEIDRVKELYAKI